MANPAFRMTNRLTRKDIASLTTTYPSWAHPDVAYAEPDWDLLRNTFEGERAVKAEGICYLPQPSGMTIDEYELYLDNATYYNMIARTVGALVGTIFKKNPVVSNLPKRLDGGIKSITKDNESLRSFTMRVAKEIVHMGRYGVLLDRPSAGQGQPYFVGYVAESILDWQVTPGEDGRNYLSEVVLMEIDELDRQQNMPRQFRPLFRVLRLIDGVYQQHIYRADEDGNVPDIYSEASQVVTPTNRGDTFDYIPFVFFGSESNLPRYERSPVIDIARLNISHYRSYAHLEHGRYYTGLPV